MKIEVLSDENIVNAQRVMDEAAAVQPKRIDFQNPFFTQPKDAKRAPTTDLRTALRGEPIHHVYLHVPFCATRCTYCHYPIMQPGAEPADAHDRYVDVLLEEIDRWASSDLDFRQLKTLAIGGGTPNMLGHRHFERILQRLADRFPNRDELSIEALPSFKILDEEKLRIFAAGGTNRVSLGIQTFDDGINELNRRPLQRAEETRALIAAAKEMFPNVSVDLLYRQRGQDWEHFVADVASVKELDVNSVYLYQVREHIGTRFIDLQRALNYFLAEMTADGAYEAVSFDQVIKKRNTDGFCRARNGRSQCENVLGIGAAAVSEIGDYTFRNVDPGSYLTSGAAVDPSTIVRREPEWLQAEWMSRGFRHFNAPELDGISFDAFRDRFGVTPGSPLMEKLQHLDAAALVKLSPGSATLTCLGMLFTQAISGLLIGHYK